MDHNPLFEDDAEERSYLQSYLELKKQQQEIDRKLETIKDLAFNEAAESLRGETKGYVFGAHLEIKYRNVWQYSNEWELKKRELDALKKYEEKTGAAKLVQQTGYLNVSFKKGGSD